MGIERRLEGEAAGEPGKLGETAVAAQGRGRPRKVRSEHECAVRAITVRVSTDLVAWVDSLIDAGEWRSRAELVERLLLRYQQWAEAGYAKRLPRGITEPWQWQRTHPSEPERSPAVFYRTSDHTRDA